jgi:CDP-diacylglycerol---glycerol-3-phosphate 3-phosphatidyltransferase
MVSTDWRHRLARPVTEPVVRFLARTPLTPNAITLSGFGGATAAALLIITGHLFWAGIIVLLASILDAFDGALARLTGKVSIFGSVLDSTLDRLAEGLLLLALLFLLVGDDNTAGAWAAGAAVLFSFLVSYIRARAEGVGLELTDGWFTRTERIIVLSLGMLSGYILVALVIIAGLSFLTASQRMYLVWRNTRAKK